MSSQMVALKLQGGKVKIKCTATPMKAGPQLHAVRIRIQQILQRLGLGL